MLDRVRDRSDRWLNIDTTFEPPEGSLCPADPDGRLTFLLHGEYLHLYQSVRLEEQRFALFNHYVAERQRVSLRVWDRFSDAGIKRGVSLTPEEVERVLGTAMITTLQALAHGLYTHTDQNIVSLQATFTELREAGKALFPGRKFVLYEPNPNIRVTAPAL